MDDAHHSGGCGFRQNLGWLFVLVQEDHEPVTDRCYPPGLRHAAPEADCELQMLLPAPKGLDE